MLPCNLVCGFDISNNKHAPKHQYPLRAYADITKGYLDLVKLLIAIVFAHLKKIIGASPDNEDGKKLLFERSPLNYVKNIKWK